MCKTQREGGKNSATYSERGKRERGEGVRWRGGRWQRRVWLEEVEGQRGGVVAKVGCEGNRKKNTKIFHSQCIYTLH